MASGTLKYQAYLVAVDHVYKQTASNVVTILHEGTDSKGGLEDDAKKNFHDCFED